MMDSKLCCVIKENSNVVKIFPARSVDPPKRLFKKKKRSHPDGFVTGRWTRKEQLSFIESTLNPE